MKSIVLVFVLFLPAMGWAEEFGVFRVHRDRDRAYMGMAPSGAFFTAGGQAPNSDGALALWNRKTAPDYVDYFRQPWKAFPIADFEALSGPIMRHVLVMRVVEAPSTGPTRCRADAGPDGVVHVIENCSQPVTGFEFVSRQVTTGLLIQWGCDETLRPVLDVGPPLPGPRLTEERQLFGFSSSKLIHVPEYARVTDPRLPEAITRKFALNFDVWRLDFGDGVERWIVYYSDFHAGPYLWMITHPNDPARRVVEEAGEVYGSC